MPYAIFKIQYLSSRQYVNNSSRSVSKMSSFIPEKHYLREVLLNYFFLKKTGWKPSFHCCGLSQPLPIIEYLPKVVSRFQKKRYFTEDKEHEKPSLKFENTVLVDLLNKDLCVGCNQKCISIRIRVLGFTLVNPFFFSIFPTICVLKQLCSRGRCFIIFPCMVFQSFILYHNVHNIRV